MIASREQIKEIVINRPNKALVAAAVEKHKLLRMHMYGDGLKDYITNITGFEEKSLTDIRKKYAKSNKALFARLGRNVDKVFSARGKSIYYNLSDNLDKMAMRYCMDVRNGMSAWQWVETYWKELFKADPNGCIFMEVGVGETYPTYKSSATYHDYSPKGAGFDYICFTVSEQEKRAAGLEAIKEKVYRFVDDAFDYYVKVVNDDIEIINSHTYTNYYRVVPAIVNSDYADALVDGLMLSLFDDVIEDAQEYLIKGSIKVTHDFRHGFPKYWEFADDCNKCGGDRVFEGKTCPECKGSGKNLILSVSKAKALNYPQTKDDPNVAPHVGGYIEPSQTYHDIATHDMALLEGTMKYTVWGTQPHIGTSGMKADGNGDVKTATEVVADLQPEIDRLMTLSSMAEKRIKFIIDSVVRFQLRENYSGASVNLGRRYLMESADTLWDRYVRAKESGADDSLLDELYFEYIETKYSTDPNGLDIMLKLKNVVPFFHKSVEEVNKLGVSDDVYKQKLYAGEWQKSVQDSYLLQTTIEQLRKDLAEYANGMELQKPDEVKSPKIGFNHN